MEEERRRKRPLSEGIDLEENASSKDWRTGLDFIAKTKYMLKLKFCVCHLLAGGGLSLFVPQMCLEIANQLKCTKLAKSVTPFPQNVH